jgi:hypothetical protein
MDEPDLAEVRHRQVLDRAANEQWFNRQTNYPYFIYMVILLLCAIAMVHMTLWLHSYDAQEREMLAHCRSIRVKISQYTWDNWRLPERLSQLDGYMQPARGWPTSPWDGLAVRESQSIEFDPRLSPGTVRYVPVMKDGKVAAWRLYVFGLQGLLYCYSGKAHLEDD